MVDWDKYRELEKRAKAIHQANPVTVEFSYDEFEQMKFGVMLLRRIQANTQDSDLLTVEDTIVPLVGRINSAFADNPVTKELHFEQMLMLKAEQ